MACCFTVLGSFDQTSWGRDTAFHPPGSGKGAHGWRPESFCPGKGDLAYHRAGRGDGDAELHPVAIGDEYMAGAVGWSGDRDDGKTPAEEGVSRVRHLNLFGKGLRRAWNGAS